MHVVFPLINTLMSGGMRVTFQYIQGLAVRGHSVTVLAPTSERASYLRLQAPITWTVIGPNTPGHRIGYARLIWELGNRIPPCDAIIANSWQTVYPALLAKRRHKNMEIFFLIQHEDTLIQGPERPLLTRFRNRLLIELAYRMPTHRMAVSRWVQEELSRRGLASSYTPNGIDLRTFFPAASETMRFRTRNREAFYVLWLARLGKFKGYGDMLTAMEEVCKSRPDVRLLVAAQQQLSVPASIPAEYVKVVDDDQLRHLYQNCDLFVFPSRLEGFGLPPLEAMACGAPTLMTDSGGVRDYARSGDNCLTVPSGQPRQLAAAILRLYDDRELAAFLADNGSRTATDFSLEKATERLDEVLRSVIQAK